MLAACRALSKFNAKDGLESNQRFKLSSDSGKNKLERWLYFKSVS